MSGKLSRRKFLRKSTILPLAGSIALSLEEKALLAREERSVGQPVPALPREPLQTGRIGNLKLSRLICGGNLISGFAHSRDLIYVSPLLRRYFTDEKVFETLRLCEENGIDAAILRVDDHILRIVNKYWKERGGKIQWIAQVKPKVDDLAWDTRLAVDNGAVGIYVQGGVADDFAGKGRVDLLGKCLEIIKRNGVVAGIGAHALATVKACVEAGLDPDFYMKTLNSKNYWSAQFLPRHDSVWAETPEETIKFMQGVKKPWIAYKVLGAGAIHPREGFKYAFENGADFCCVGMFDFQVAEDVAIAKSAVAEAHNRSRPWCG